MDAPELNAVLPPILIGVGALVPLLIGKNPFTVAERDKPLLCTLFILLTWVSHLLAFNLYRWLFFNNWLSILFLALAGLCFAVLLPSSLSPVALAPAPDETLLPDGGLNPGSPTKPAVTKAKKRRRSGGFFRGAAAFVTNRFAIYCLGIVSVTIASTVILAGKDWVLVDITWPVNRSGEISGVALVKHSDNKPWRYVASQQFLDDEEMLEGCRVIIPKADYDSADWESIQITVTDKSPGANGLRASNDYTVDKSHLRKLLQPAEAIRYEGKAATGPQTSSEPETSTD